MRIGYGRVSTRDQNPDSQRDALIADGCDRIYIDKVSGKLASRPELDKALDQLRRGDQLVITRLTRLGRSLKNLMELVEQFREQDIDLIVLQQGLDTTTAGGRLIFHVMASIAEFERELIVEGTYEGLAAARARGRVGGRKAKLTPRQAKVAREMYDSRDYTVDQIAAEFGVSRPTIYRHIGKLADNA